MLAIRKARPERGVKWPTSRDRNPGPDELLLRVRRAGICGSDRHLYAWDSWAELNFPTPFTLGHEIVGEVAGARASRHGLRRGRNRAVESHIFDGSVVRAGQATPTSARTCAFLASTSMAGLPSTSACPRASPGECAPKSPLSAPSLFEPLGNAVHAAMRYDVSGQPIAVYGCGPMGLMAIAVAHSVGAYPIVASDVSAYRRGLAEAMGAHATLEATSPTFGDDLVDALGSHPTVSLEMSGHPDAFRQALRLSANAGKVVLLGIPPEPVTIDLADDVLFKGLEVYGVTGRLIWDTWYRTEAFLIRHGDALDPMLTHTFPLAQFENAMTTVQSGQCGKVLLDTDA